MGIDETSVNAFTSFLLAFTNHVLTRHIYSISNSEIIISFPQYFCPGDKIIASFDLRNHTCCMSCPVVTAVEHLLKVLIYIHTVLVGRRKGWLHLWWQTIQIWCSSREINSDFMEFSQLLPLPARWRGFYLTQKLWNLKSRGEYILWNQLSPPDVMKSALA